MGTNLNNPGGDIRINIETQDIFTDPSESFLIIEGQFTKNNVNKDPYADADVISLTNNGMMYLFKNIKYQLSGQDIETVKHPGQATTMLGFLFDVRVVKISGRFLQIARIKPIVV